MVVQSEYRVQFFRTGVSILLGVEEGDGALDSGKGESGGEAGWTAADDGGVEESIG